MEKFDIDFDFMDDYMEITVPADLWDMFVDGDVLCNAGVPSDDYGYPEIFVDSMGTLFADVDAIMDFPEFTECPEGYEIGEDGIVLYNYDTIMNDFDTEIKRNRDGSVRIYIAC